MIGVSIFMGCNVEISGTEVQCAGSAFRISRTAMQREFARGGELQHLSLLLTQSSQAAVCNQHHSVEQRFCRWLLMSMDRLSSNEVLVTQEMIPHLLGVRRESVTLAAKNLQKEGLIEYSRGCICIVDRVWIEARVCECFEVVKDEYHRLLYSENIKFAHA